MGNELRIEILRRIDLVAEFQRLGGRIPPNATPNADGWLTVHAIDREDEHPSAAINVGNNPNTRGIYVDHGGAGKRGESWFDMAARMPQSNFMTGGDAFKYYGTETGAYTGGDNGHGKAKQPEYKPAPTQADVEQFQKNLTPETLQDLHEKRGLTDDTIERLEIGWDVKRGRNSIPVRDEHGNLVNIRFHNSKKDPKTLSWGTGYGKARLYGLDRLVKAAPGTTILISEGEFDAMVAEQETGMLAVSSTNGAKAFVADWVENFYGFHVVTLYDCDAAGREGLHKLITPAFRAAVESGKVLSFKIVWLYDLPVDKAHKDVTDWIVKDGGTGAQLKEKIAKTAPHVYPPLVTGPEPPIELQSFEQIDHSDNTGKRVTVPIQIYGENTVAYHAVGRITVTHCLARLDGKCTGRGTASDSGLCLQPLVVPPGDRVLIAGVHANEGQLKNHLREYMCDKNKRPEVAYQDSDRITIREVYAHQVVGAMAAERTELVEHPVYVEGGQLVEIGKYQATGRIITSFKNQQPTMLIDTLERMEEDYQTFTVEKYRLNLEKLKAMDPEDIVDDLAVHVTRIYERQDLHLGVLLLLCSPLRFEFPGEKEIRGWLSAIVVGDTGTGKTTVSEGLLNFAQVGNRVSGMTASRTGITYGIDYDERRGWRIKAGALLKMNRQALIVDEAQDIAQQDLKTMAEGIDTGIMRIDRIQNKVFESKTRVLFGCNPVNPKMHASQRTMDSFRYGCEAIQGIFPEMMIRRIDFVMFAASWDIDDKEKIYFPEIPDTEQQVLREDLQALIFFAWNLKPEQIVISERTALFIRQIAKSLSDVCGGADDLPIVYAEDFRKTMARLSVAFAVLDLNTTDDFEQVIVEIRHVGKAYDLLERMYRAENCRLDQYAKSYLESHGMGDLPEVRNKIDKVLSGKPEKAWRFAYIVCRLLTCQDGDKVRKVDLVEELEVDKPIVQQEMRFFSKNHLVQPTQQGYVPLPRMIRLFNKLEKVDPETYKFEKIRDRLAETIDRRGEKDDF
jgi:hypothetical protein